MIRFEHTARALYAMPWAIRPEVYQVFHDVFQRHFADPKNSGQIETPFGKLEYKTPDDYTIENGVAVITIAGALGHRIGAFEKACMGACDYLDIAKAIDKANDDPAASSILMHISSPGGMVTGLPETAAKIAASEKPVVAFTDDLAASAGYYLAASASAIYATESAQVGSIGTIMSWLDVSKAYEAQGVKREMVSSGKYKGMLTPGIPITEEQRVHLQDIVDTLADEFKEHVTARRGNIDPDYMEGQSVWGKEAKAAGLIDEIGLFQDALTEAQELAETKE
jgi:protease-4